MTVVCRSLVALVVFAVGLVGPRFAHACSCIPAPSVAAELQKAAAVFLGIARGDDPAPPDTLPNLHQARSVRFEVLRRWKGEVTATQVVFTAGNEAACGLEPRLGERYLIYAFAPAAGSPLTMHLCSRSSPERYAADDLAALGAGEPPLPDLAPTSGPDAATSNDPAPRAGCALMPGAAASHAPVWIIGLLLAGWARRLRRS